MDHKVLGVNGGEGDNSYSKNSFYQRIATNVVKDRIDEVIMEKLDVQKLSSSSDTIRIADMGCATGPNTLIAMQNLIDVVKQKYMSQFPTSDGNINPKSGALLEFQVFFNDHVSNDFTTLFTSLPGDKPYFAAGVPGSFHGRLFPRSFLHLAYSSVALHWLSAAPEKLANSSSKAWNPGRVHYTNAPIEVEEAYKAQFAEDFGSFLNARAIELVPGGMVIIIIPGIPDGMPHHQVPSGIMYDLMASSFIDMVKNGLIKEEQVDSFNLPLYTPSPSEMSELIGKNGSFDIEILELTSVSSSANGPSTINIPEWVKHVRAAMEGMLVLHFELGIIDELHSRLLQKLLDASKELESSYRDKLQLLVVLKHK